MKSIEAFLARRILSNIGVWIAIITVVCSGFSYYVTYSRFQNEIEQQLVRFGQSRNFFENDLFAQAQKNVLLVRNTFLRQLERTKFNAVSAEFSSLIRLDRDGVWRVNATLDDYRHKATVSIFPNAKLDGAFKRDILLAYDVISQFGPAFYLRYHTAFIDLGEDEASIAYSPEVNYARTTTVSMSAGLGAEALAYAANITQKEKVYWTDMYYDRHSGHWLVSVIAPIVGNNGHYYGRAGLDILLSHLIDLINVNPVEGSFNMIVGKEGELIAHPNKMQQIREANGYLSVNYSQDAELSQIYEAIASKKNTKNLIQTKDGTFLLSVVPLQGTKWFFVTAYPKKLLQAKARYVASIVWILGLLALLIQVFFVARVLKKNVTLPLEDLRKGVRQLMRGERGSILPIARRDEIGVLARDFDLMANKLKSYQDETEIEVKVRTDMLSQRNQVLLDANAELIRQEKDKNTVLMTVAYTLKESVVGIKEMVALLQNRLTAWPREKIMNKFDMIEGLSTNLLQLLENVLDVGMLEAGKYPISVKAIAVQPLLQELRQYYQTRLELKRQVLIIRGDNATIEADRSALRQVLDNVISNACKYTPHHGQIIIHVFQKEKEIDIVIEDQGPGIVTREQGKLFQKFSLLSSKPTGGEFSTGLGLFIVSHLLQLMRGEIRCESQFGSGTKFIVTLPRGF